MAKQKPASRAVKSTKQERSIRAKINFGHKLTLADCKYALGNLSKFTTEEQQIIKRRCRAAGATGGRRPMMTEAEILAMDKRTRTSIRRGQMDPIGLTPFMINRALGPYKVF